MQPVAALGSFAGSPAQILAIPQTVVVVRNIASCSFLAAVLVYTPSGWFLFFFPIHVEALTIFNVVLDLDWLEACRTMFEAGGVGNPAQLPSEPGYAWHTSPSIYLNGYS
ncbi:hypothetical protein OBBRIDRAFT_840327 [Obba rivulosa]|uniref:Uncharacterized protein n=1 Tax=Obba rivulosa TaxID=1052685 RepID=A0A8E2AN30_9APHY|nr:hypothetical protein OBBRIDRAFT_840327 [Obba rivulosa]